MANVEAPRRSGGRGHVVGPLILLGAGVLLLLNNLDILPWTVWRDLWPFWPVLLVLLGIEALATGRVAWGTLVMLIVLLPVLGVLVSAGSWGSHWQEATRPSPDRLTASLSQPLGSAQAAMVDVEYGAGALQIGPLPDDLAQSTLADAQVYGRGSVRLESANLPGSANPSTSPGRRPTRTPERSRGGADRGTPTEIMRLQIPPTPPPPPTPIPPPTPPSPPTPPAPPTPPTPPAPPTPPSPPTPPAPPDPNRPRLRILQRDDDMDPSHFDLGRLDVRLSPAIPIDLRVASGATDSTLNLEALRIPNLTLETGASQTRVILPARGETMARIEGGAAKLDLTVPPNVAARIIVSDGPNAVSIDETRFPLQGREYRSANFDTATDRVTLRIDVGVSRLIVQ